MKNYVPPRCANTSLSVVANSWYKDYWLEEDASTFRVATNLLTVEANRKTGAIRYYDGKDRLLTREPDRGGKSLTPKKIYRDRFSEELSVASTTGIDGVRASAAESERGFDRQAFEAKLEFVFVEDEALFGLGSHEEGYGNLRGKSENYTSTT